MKIRAAHRWAMVALFFMFSGSVFAANYQVCRTTVGGSFKYWNYDTGGTCSHSGGNPYTSGSISCSTVFSKCNKYVLNIGDGTAAFYDTDSIPEGYVLSSDGYSLEIPTDGLVDATDYTGDSDDIARLDMCDSGPFVDRRNASLCGDDLYCRTAINTVKKFEVNECVDIGSGDAPYEYDPNKLYTHLNNMRYLLPNAPSLMTGCHSAEFENLTKTCQHNQVLECQDANGALFQGVCQQEYQPVTNPATGESSAQLMSDVGTPLTYDGSLDMNGSPDGASTWQLNLTIPEPVNNTGFQIGSGGSGGSTGSGGSGGYDNTGSGGSYGGGYTETGSGATNETINNGSGDAVDDGSGVTGTLKSLVGKSGAGFGSEADQALLTAQDELSTTYSNIKGEFDSVFSGSVTNGTAQLPTWNIGTVKGNEVVVDWTKWHSGLFTVGNAVLVLAALIAFGVVFL